MDDAACVRAGERAAYVTRDANRFGEPQIVLPFQACLERFALEVLHDDVRNAFGRLAVVVHLNGVAGLQARRGFRLQAETLPRVGRARLLSRNQLDGDALPERRVRRRPHGAHRAATELVIEPVFRGDDVSLSKTSERRLRKGDGIAHDGAHARRPGSTS